ncbi:MAG TPA: RNA 2',3'-cyclic phosphodiesterase [Longimicrobiales bacterium]|nr:RNA 2',3'-cyclic phosphodiesterase [Longimicrobiales bacterium]
MRLFIAINFTAKDRQRMHRAARKLRERELPIRWEAVEQLHLTLKFLGEVRPESVGRVKEAVARVAEKTSPFTLTMEGAGAFPTLRRPRVIWLGAEASPELRCLKHDLEWELAPLGFEREVRAFHAHVTLGRALKEARAGDFRDFEEAVSGLSYRAEIPVRTVDIMESHLARRGARYTRVLAAKLGQHARAILARAAS